MVATMSSIFVGFICLVSCDLSDGRTFLNRVQRFFFGFHRRWADLGRCTGL